MSIVKKIKLNQKLIIRRALPIAAAVIATVAVIKISEAREAEVVEIKTEDTETI